MSGPGLGPKTIPQPAGEPSERRGENKVRESHVKEENCLLLLLVLLLPYEAC